MTNMSVVEAPHSKKTIGQLSDIEKNPCWEESQMSYRCLSENNFDKDLCSNAFQNYRNCKKFWNCVVKSRKVQGIIPPLPSNNDRAEARAFYREQCGF